MFGLSRRESKKRLRSNGSGAGRTSGMEATKVESGLVSGVEYSTAVPATRHNITLEPTAQVKLSAVAQRDRYTAGRRR
jgi:hypothetical protein